MNCSSGDNLPYSTRVAIAISVPIGSFVIITLLLIIFYVHKNTNDRNYRPPPTHKSISKSDSAWSKSPNYKSPNYQTPSRKSHSRQPSGNSRPYPGIAPLKPEKIPMPGPLRPRSSKSTIASRSPHPTSPIASRSPYPTSPIPPVPPIPLQNRAPNPPVPFSTLLNQTIPQPPVSPPPNLASPSQTFLPATRYSPTSSKPRKTYQPPISKFRRKAKPKEPPPLPPQPAGLVSWERIAVQNAQIRAAQQGQSPSPAVSPLSQPPPRNRNNTQPTTQFIPPLSQSPAFMDMDDSTREATPFRLGTPLHPPPPRTPKRKGTPGQGDVLREREGRVVSQGWDGRGASGGEGWGGTSWYDERDNSNGNGDGVGGVLQAGRWSANEPVRVVGRMDSETLGNTTIAMGRGAGGRGGGDSYSTRSSSTLLSAQRGNNRAGRATTGGRTSEARVAGRTWAPREEFRADTPNPDDGRLVRRSEGGVMRMGSGRSKGSRKEVRWSKDVDYEGR